MNLNSSLKDASFFRNKGENFHVDGYNSLNYVIKNIIPDFSAALSIVAGAAFAIGGAIKLFSNLKK